MKIHAIGGYDEVGKNMTAVETGKDAVLLDDGVYLPAVIETQEKERDPSEKTLRSLGAFAHEDYLKQKGVQSKIRAIACSHAHLDHIGALQHNAHRYPGVPILGTPFTTEVIKVLAKDSKKTIPNKIIPVGVDKSYKLGKNSNYKIEFLNSTHSTIQASMIALHTPEGIVLYTNDYKLDNSPTFGKKPNYKRLKQLSKIGIKALVADCLYAPDDRKTPSEKIAKGLLEDVFFSTDNSRAGMVVTTFSSHIARLNTITQFGKKLGRKVVFFGRSLSKYTSAARNIGQAPFIKDIEIYTYRRQREKALRKINKNKSKYLVVCTGHQGEPGSILDRIGRGKVDYRLSSEDQVIFSSKTIPTPINEESKLQLVKRLKRKDARIFDNVHVSGHGGREDLRDLIKLTNPEHVIPSHGDLRMRSAGIDLAKKMGYRKGKTAHLMSNKTTLNIK